MIFKGGDASKEVRDAVAAEGRRIRKDLEAYVRAEVEKAFKDLEALVRAEGVKTRREIEATGGETRRGIEAVGEEAIGTLGSHSEEIKSVREGIGSYEERLLGLEKAVKEMREGRSQ